MDRVDSLRWRLRAFRYGTLALLGVNRDPRVAYLRDRRMGPRPVRAEQPPRPPWSGPPDDEVGVAVAARMVIASQPRLFIAVTDCAAYSNGFSLGLAVRSKDDIDPEQMGMRSPFERENTSGIQIGIRFSDGREVRANGYGPNPMLMRYYKDWSEGKSPEAPPGPVIGPTSGGGGGRNWNFNYFIALLPPDGPVMITCRWPARGLQTAGKELNGTSIRAAGLKSKSVWG